MSHVWLIVCWRLLQYCLSGPVAQLVEQRIENPRVGSSILPQATIFTCLTLAELFVLPLNPDVQTEHRYKFEILR